jgi:hypothetical protein
LQHEKDAHRNPKKRLHARTAIEKEVKVEAKVESSAKVEVKAEVQDDAKADAKAIPEGGRKGTLHAHICLYAYFAQSPRPTHRRTARK